MFKLYTIAHARGSRTWAASCARLVHFIVGGDRPINLSEARSRLDRSRFSRPNTHFAAFFKIYKKITFSRANSANFCQKIGNFCKIFDIFWQILQNFAKFSEIRKNFAKFCRIFGRIVQKCVDFEKCLKMLYWMQKIMNILLESDDNLRFRA